MSRDRIIMLQERAEELGFSTITEAIDAGYHEVQDLVAGTFTLEKIDEQEKAHEAWLKERAAHLEALRTAAALCVDNGIPSVADDITEAVDFFERGEC